MGDERATVLGLDIGSSSISGVVCEIDAESGISLCGIGHSVSAGLEKGKVVDLDDFQRALDRCVSRALQTVHRPVRQVITSLPLHGIQFTHNVGLITCRQDSGQISLDEKHECVRRSKNVIKAPDQKIVHALPLAYRVDGTVVKEPVGVFGRHLEVETHIVLGDSDNMLALSHGIRYQGLQIRGIAFDPIGTAQIVLRDDERDKGALLLDIGGHFTKVCYFKGNRLAAAKVIPIGGETFTNDVALCLKVPQPEAERIKVMFGEVDPSRVSEDEQFEAKTTDKGRVNMTRHYLSRILESRAKELLTFIRDDLPDDDAITARVLCGGGSQLRGLSTLLKRELACEFRDGVPDDMRPIIKNADDVSAAGLVIYGLKTGAVELPKIHVKGLKNRIKTAFRELF